MDPTVKELFTPEDVLLIAPLASRRNGDPDTVDRCINECVPRDLDDEINAQYVVQKFVPFDPVSKRTEAHILDKKTGKTS